MRLEPKFSYEFNCVLNPDFSEDEQIKNFASIISDKDRFLVLLPYFERNKDFIEKRLGFQLPQGLEFYVVRCEKLKSFSEPVTIEYSINPQEMFLFLFKEILKVAINIRFPDEVTREKYINSFISYVCVSCDFDSQNFEEFEDVVHNESKKLYPDYEDFKIDFSTKTMREYLEDMYKND